MRISYCISDVCSSDLRINRQLFRHLAGPEETVWLRSGTVRCRKAAVHDHLEKHGAVRRQADRRSEGAAQAVSGFIPDERVSEPPRLDRKSTRLNSSH